MDTCPRRKKILNFLRKNPNATQPDIMKAAGIKHRSMLDYHMSKLMAAGLVRKNDKYEVVEKV